MVLKYLEIVTAHHRFVSARQLPLVYWKKSLKKARSGAVVTSFFGTFCASSAKIINLTQVITDHANTEFRNRLVYTNH